MSNYNSKLRTQNSKLFQPAFTLIELMIVVSILGILAAIALPEFKTYTQQAKEAALKSTLRTIRETIERYAAEHNGTPPGYTNGITTVNPSGITFSVQIQYYTSKTGGLSMTRTSTCCYGPYLKKIPKNPFNNLTNVTIVPDGTPFPATPTAECGWMFQGSTKIFRLAYSGTDSEGKNYFDY